MAKRITLRPNLYSLRRHRAEFAVLLLVLLLGLPLLLPRNGWTHNRFGQPSPENCYIRIQSRKHSGEQSKLTFKTHLESKTQCKRLAQLHTPNFEPNAIARKDVSFRWKTY